MSLGEAFDGMSIPYEPSPPEALAASVGSVLTTSWLSAGCDACATTANDTSINAATSADNH